MAKFLAVTQDGDIFGVLNIFLEIQSLDGINFVVVFDPDIVAVVASVVADFVVVVLETGVNIINSGVYIQIWFFYYFTIIIGLILLFIISREIFH